MKGAMRFTKPALCMPYSNHNLIGYEISKEWAIERDLWSIGVVIIEILAGSEVVMRIDDEDKLVQTLNVLKPLIGPDLHHLLRMLTLWEKDKPVRGMMRKNEPTDHQKFRFDVDQIEQAKGKGQSLDVLLHQPDEAAEEAA